MTREQIHADQLARMREWATSSGHRPDVFRRRPTPDVLKGINEAVVRGTPGSAR